MRSLFFLVLLIIASSISSYKWNTADQEPFSIPLFSAAMDDTISCYRIPSLVTATNGDLIAAVDQRVSSCGDLNSNETINIVMRRSTDQGKSWSAIAPIVDFPEGQSASDPSMIVDPVTETIFLFYNFMDLRRSKNQYQFHLIKSNDHGRSWSAPEDITNQITKKEWLTDFKFITSGRGSVTKSGELLHTMVNLKRGLFVFGSKDHGNSWYLKPTSIQPADESKIIEVADGQLMINSRVNGAGYRYVHRSIDQGLSWNSSLDLTLRDPGCNATLISYPLSSNKAPQHLLLFANSNSSNDRINLTVRVSYDQGRTWSKGKTIYRGSSAYSSMTALTNGDIGLLFEKDAYSRIEFVRFSLKWLTTDHD